MTVSWITPEHLGAGHLAALVRAVGNVLSTQEAELAFAQIIDGFPTADSFTEFHPFFPAEDEHPVAKHLELCEGVVDAAREARARLNPLALRFDPHVSVPQGKDARSYGTRLTAKCCIGTAKLPGRGRGFTAVLPETG